VDKAVLAEYDREAGFMRVTLAGDLVVEDLEAAESQVLAHAGFRMGMGVLWDLRAATVAGLSAADFRRLRLFVRVRRAARGGGKTAVVVAHVVDYGLVRMFEVFRELVSAEAWLLADAEP
jgi:hypothetical protein